MNLIRRLRDLVGMTQEEFARELGVRQAAVSSYESGRRSPNLDVFSEAAERSNRRVVLAPTVVQRAWSRSEQFSRLLYLEVAQEFLADPTSVRDIAAKQLAAQEQRARSGDYVAEWRRLLEPGSEGELLTVLCIPDSESTGLLSSSPFAGVVDDDVRLRLLEKAGRFHTIADAR